MQNENEEEKRVVRGRSRSEVSQRSERGGYKYRWVRLGHDAHGADQWVPGGQPAQPGAESIIATSPSIKYAKQASNREPLAKRGPQ